jgi:hypothetical protein
MKISSLFSKSKEFNKTFLGQNPDEEILGITRRGFIIELKWFLPVVFVYVFLVFNLNFLELLIGNIFTDSYISFIRILIFLIVTIFTLNRLSDWFYSVNLVTNQRVIDFEFSGLGVKKIVETDMRNIQSVTIESSGFLSFFFGLSTIHILTSGDNPNIDLEFISNANQIQVLISDLARSTYKK